MMHEQLTLIECARREKISNYWKGKSKSKEHKQKISLSEKGKVVSEETKNKLREAWKKRTPITDGTKQKLSESSQKIAKSGYYQSENYRKLVSMGKQGLDLESWKGFVSFEPYCHKFNYALKEKIRNKYSRICVLCGKSEIENGRRLDVHHIDGDKMQGCEGKKFLLVPLCHSCHATKDTDLKMFCILSNSEWID